MFNTNSADLIQAPPNVVLLLDEGVVEHLLPVVLPVERLPTALRGTAVGVAGEDVLDANGAERMAALVNHHHQLRVLVLRGAALWALAHFGGAEKWSK